MVIFWNQRLSDESVIAILAFLKLVFTWHYFCPFSFNSSMSLYFRCFFYKKHIVGFCIFIQVRNFCLTRLIHLNFLWLYKFRVIFNARFLFFKYLFFPSLLLFFSRFYSIGQLTPLIIEYIHGQMQAGLRVPSGQEIRENKEGDFFFQSLLEHSKLIL